MEETQKNKTRFLPGFALGALTLFVILIIRDFWLWNRATKTVTNKKEETKEIKEEKS